MSEPKQSVTASFKQNLEGMSRTGEKEPRRKDTAIFDQSGWDTTPKDKRAVAAEFFAMTLFVWVGCGAAVSSQSMLVFNPDDTRENTFLLSVAVAFGFAITVLAYTIAPLSGGHINPAVTLAFVLLGDMSWKTGMMYGLSQFMGSLLGAAIVWGTFADTTLEESGGGNNPPFLIGANSVTAGFPVASAFLGEFMGTYLLVWTVLMTAVFKRSIAGNLAPIAIGWSVMLAHLVLIPITGCGINPARSFGPMIVVIMAREEIGLEGWWIYYTAPFVGAAAAAWSCKYLFGVLTDDYDGVFGKHVENKKTIEDPKVPIEHALEEEEVVHT